jgi:predicted nucleic acid-binding protein
MTSWLVDTPLLKMPGSPAPSPLRRWCETRKPSLFLSAVSLCEISAAIEKGLDRRDALRDWLAELTESFADRVHNVDVAISREAGAILPRLAHAHPLHRRHDAILVATARAYGHGLLTRRDGVFGPWTQTPIEVI